MPKILGYKALPIVVAKGTAYARTIKMDVECFYKSEETDTEEKKLGMQKAKNMEEPYHCGSISLSPDIAGDDVWLFGEWAFTLTPYDETLDNEKLKLLLLEAIDAEQGKFERLSKKFSNNKKDRAEITVVPNANKTRWVIMIDGKQTNDSFNTEKEALAKAEEYSKE